MFDVTKNNINLIIDNKKVGYILYDEKSDYIVGSYIYVNPEDRGKGYSSQLIEEFAGFVKEKGKNLVATCPVIKRAFESNYSELLKK